MKPSCRVVIYGGGAVGSIFGWRIAQHSHAAVSVVCRSNWDHVRRSGYLLQTKAWGTGHFRPHEVFKSGSLPKPLLREPFDYCVVANKVTEGYESTLAELQALVSPHTTLVTAQNGMDVEVPLRRLFPRHTILSAVCNIGCSQIRPGHVEQSSSIKRPAFLIGVHGERSATDAQKRDALSALDAEFESIECVHRERWQKLVFNSAWNSTTALTGLNTHQLLEQPGAADLVARIASETYKVATASGVRLDSDLPAQTVELARCSPPITPSMLQDARSRRPLELPPIFGYLTSQAAKLGLHVPYLTWVHDLLQQQSRGFVAQRASKASTLQEPTCGDHASIIDLLSQELPQRFSVAVG